MENVSVKTEQQHQVPVQAYPAPGSPPPGFSLHPVPIADVNAAATNMVLMNEHQKRELHKESTRRYATRSKTKHLALEAKCKQQEFEIWKLKSEMHRLKSEKEYLALEKRCKEQESQIFSLKSETASLKSEISGLNSINMCLKSETLSLKSEISGLSSVNLSLKSEISGLSSINLRLKSETERLKVEKDQQVQTSKKLENQVNYYKGLRIIREYDTVKCERDTVKCERDRARQRSRELEKELASVKERLKNVHILTSA